MALVVILILSVRSLAGQIYQVVTWELYDKYGVFMIISAALTVIFVILAIVFVVQAVKRDHKFMICAIVALIVVVVMGVSMGALACAIVCGYWLLKVTRPEGKPLKKPIKALFVIATVAVIAAYLSWTIMSMGYWSEWGPASLEAGDWSEWETEETLQNDKNDVHHDGNGNSSTTMVFEFDE